MLSGGEVMLECDVGGGELLIVAEEGLDLAVLDGDAVFEDDGVCVGSTVVETRGFVSGEWDLDFAVFPRIA